MLALSGLSGISRRLDGGLAHIKCKIPPSKSFQLISTLWEEGYEKEHIYALPYTFRVHSIPMNQFIKYLKQISEQGQDLHDS